MKYEINIYNKAKEQQQKKQEELKVLSEENRKKDHEIYFRYMEIESQIRIKKHAEEKLLREETEKQKAKIEARAKQADEDRTQFKTIINYMDLLNNEYKKDAFQVYIYDYPKDENGEIKRVLKGGCYCYPEKERVPVPSIATHYEDDSLLLKAYIGDNDKPKNKYSLFIVGSSRLKPSRERNGVIELKRDYGFKTHTDGEDIRINIKDFPTKKEALAYYERNKNKMLKSFIEEHQQKINTLEEVRANTCTDEWAKAYLIDKKEYYENCYSRHEENEDYKQIVKTLEALK